MAIRLIRQEYFYWRRSRLNKDSMAQYSATTYADDELKESRAYAILKLNF